MSQQGGLLRFQARTSFLNSWKSGRFMQHQRWLLGGALLQLLTNIQGRRHRIVCQVQCLRELLLGRNIPIFDRWTLFYSPRNSEGRCCKTEHKQCFHKDFDESHVDVAYYGRFRHGLA